MIVYVTEWQEGVEFITDSVDKSIELCTKWLMEYYNEDVDYDHRMISIRTFEDATIVRCPEIHRELWIEPTEVQT